MHYLPRLDQAVEALLVIQAADGNSPLRAQVRTLDVLQHRRIRNHTHSRDISPHTGILLCQHDKTVEAPHEPVIRMRPPSVGQSHKPAAAVLQMEQLTLVQLKHLTAAILQVRDERALPRIKTVGHVRPQLHQQGLQGLPVRPAPPEIAQGLEYEILPVVIRVIHSEIHELHPFRERIEGWPVLLVRRRHDYPERPPLRMLKQPADLVQKHPLHPAGIVEGVYTK